MYEIFLRLLLNLPSIICQEMCKTSIYNAFLLQQHYFPKMENVLAVSAKININLYHIIYYSYFEQYNEFLIKIFTV